VYINTRVLILTNNVQFSMQTTQALERAGAFKVAPFASIENALASLEHAPQDVILLDTTLENLSVEAFIQQVRTIQPDIAFILLPETTINQQWVSRLKLHGAADYTWTARRLVPLIKQAQRTVYEDQPKTSQVKVLPRATQDESTKRIAALSVPGDDPVEFLLSDAADGETRVEVVTPEDSKGVEVFRKLADEEPPMPSFEESATIRDLRDRLVNPSLLKDINGIARDMDDEDEDTPSSGTSEEDTPSPAALILASSADDSTPLDAFSLDAFLARIQEQMLESGRTLQPLPSWVQESEKYVREPDFLDEDLPGIITPSTPLEYTAPVTTPLAPQPPSYNELDTERSQPYIRSYPISSEESSAASAVQLPDPTLYETKLEPDVTEESGETLTLPTLSLARQASDPIDEGGETRELPTVSLARQAAELPRLGETETTRTPSVPLSPAPTAADGERSYIEQLTVTLLQVSLELTAEATLLIREGQIIAHDGVLPIDDVRELFQQTGQNWEAEPLQGRIRFVTLPASGQDYMLYSRGMDTGVTLCLIFAGTLPLYTIRRQGKRLADAMATVPAPPLASFFPGEAVAEIPTEVEELEDVETGERLPFTYLWPVRDDSVSLSYESRVALSDYYQRQLPKRGWELQALDVQEDYIYLVVSHPATQSATQRLQDLQQRAAVVIGRVQDDVPAELWASSYTVLIPGRDLTLDEIHDFLEFARS
jgi:DNA-binding NarL/FixJ family response regulator